MARQAAMVHLAGSLAWSETDSQLLPDRCSRTLEQVLEACDGGASGLLLGDSMASACSGCRYDDRCRRASRCAMSL